ncbi:hypothetical protein ACF3M1_12945 [Luteimonas sp. WGS1318]|uniref:hypothetical protein n=1 Tax=Luteimonas sp. WGS1318 TaxID=3366815 RepID=UPI00372D48D0
MSRLSPCVLLPVLIAGALASPAPGHAQVRRCVGPDGGTVYTDRACSAVGASNSLAERPRGQAPAYRGGCQRQLRGLIQEMSHAIHSGDTNRLVTLYHWRGMSQSSGYQVLDRLDAITQQPLLDITAQRPAQPVVASTTPFSGWVSARDIPTAAPERPPTSLRVDQAGPGGSGTRQTVFSLHRHLGCWWVSL